MRVLRPTSSTVGPASSGRIGTSEASHASRRDVSAETYCAPWSTSRAPSKASGRGSRGGPRPVGHGRVGVHVQHDLIAVARGAAVEVGRQGGLGQQPERVGSTLGRASAPRPSASPVGRDRAVSRNNRSAAASSARCTTAPTSGVSRPRITTMPSSSTHVESWRCQMPRLRLSRRLHAVHAPPGAHEPFDVRRRAGERHVEERLPRSPAWPRA